MNQVIPFPRKKSDEDREAICREEIEKKMPTIAFCAMVIWALKGPAAAAATMARQVAKIRRKHGFEE